MNLLRSRVVAVFLCLIPLIPIWYFDYLPLQDYPNHLARLSILCNYEHSDFYKQHFTVDFFKGLSPLPYLALDLFVSRLAALITVDSAMRLFISLYVVVYMISLFLLASDMKRDFGLLLLLNLPVMYSSFFHFGFLNFMFSIPLFLLTIWSLRRYEERKDALNIVLFGILSLLLYLSHVFTYFLFLIFLFGYLAAGIIVKHRSQRGMGVSSRCLSVKEYAYPLIAVLPSFVLNLNYLLLSTNYRPMDIVRYESASQPWFYKVLLLTFPFSYMSFDYAVFYSILYVIALYLITRKSLPPNRAFLMFSFLLLLVYFGLPLKAAGDSIDGFNIDARSLLFCLILFPLSLNVRQNRNTDLARGILYILFFISFSALLHSFSGFNNTFSASCARVIEPGSTVFQISAVPSGSAVRPYHHAWGYFGGRREILTPYLFAGGQIPIEYKDRPPVLDWTRINGMNKGAERDLLRTNYDYVLLIGADPVTEEFISTISRKTCEDREVRVYKMGQRRTG